jgi:hypothetical protein
MGFVGTPPVIEPSPGRFSGDAGLPPVRRPGQSINLTGAFAEALDDPRHPDRTERPFPEMVWSRVSGILSGYADPNDPDTLRADPVFEPVADRSPDDNDLARVDRGFPSTTSPMKGDRPCRRGPCARRTATPRHGSHFRQSASDTSTEVAGKHLRRLVLVCTFVTLDP